MVVNYTRWVIKWRWLILIAVFGFVALVGSGARFLGFDTSYRVFFSKDNPQLNAFEALQNIYTKNDNVLFVFEPKDGQVFTNKQLKVIEDFTAESWKIPYAIRVDAVTNFQHTEAFDDDLFVEDLIVDAESLTPEEIAKAKRIAVKEPQLLHRLISPEAHVTGINVTFEQPGTNAQKEVPEIVNYARNLADTYRQSNPDMNIYLTGVVMLNNAFSESGINDLTTLVPIM